MYSMNLEKGTVKLFKFNTIRKRYVFYNDKGLALSANFVLTLAMSSKLHPAPFA